MSIELLSPAGSLNKLKTAIEFGADAVYIGGSEFGLRTASQNADFEELREGIDFAHKKSARVYIACNIVARNDDIRKFPEFLRQLKTASADALIITDLGMFSAAREYEPDMEIHISTQANSLNFESCNFFHKLGAKRIILARELSLDEIKDIRKNTPKDLDLEAFVHGAMCVSYSGRCLLSNYMASRESNKGDCAHPCRWNYSLMEEKRQGEYFPVYEDEQGTFILNSKDLCMIEHIPELFEAGIKSFKIEGRVKSEYYAAAVTAAYRAAIDEYEKNPDRYTFNDKWFQEVCKVSHRDYYTGFYFGDKEGQIYATSSYIRECDMIAIVEDYDEKTGRALCMHKNKFKVGDSVEVLEPESGFFPMIIEEMTDIDLKPLTEAVHPEMRVYIKMPKPVKKHSIIRRQK